MSRKNAADRDMGSHVTLSKETVEKLIRQSDEDLRAPPPTYLDPWDILRLERHARQVTEAQAAVSEIGYKLEALRAEYEKQVHHLTHERSAREAYLGKMRTLHQRSADDLAKRHHVNWATHAYNPDTGQIRLIE